MEADPDLTIASDKIELSTLCKIQWELEDLLLFHPIDFTVYQHIQNLDLSDPIKNVSTTFYFIILFKQGLKGFQKLLGKIPLIFFNGVLRFFPAAQ